MALRLTSRGRARGASLRGSGALLAVAVTAGLATHATPAVAEGSSDSGAEAYLADLVGRVSDTQDQVTALETRLGGLRESVNKSRVDVDRSTRAAVDAQNSVTAARDRLGGSQDDLDVAQSDLDEIARSAYTQGGDAAPVPLASGTTTADAIDRSTYIRMAAEQQQTKVDQLDLARTQAANEESRLRDARDAADASVAEARDAQNDAQAQFDRVTGELAEKSGEHRTLLDAAESAREQLAAARAAVDRAARSGASSFDKRHAAEAAVAAVGAGVTGTEDDGDTAVGTSGDDRGATAPAIPDTVPESTKADVTAVPGADPTTVQDTTDPGAEPDTADPAVTESTVTPGNTEDPEAGLPDDGATGTDGSFTRDVAGDDLRQAAVDGLVDAAGSAFYAGTGAALSGHNPVRAARTAARDVAAAAYDSLPGAGDGSGVGEDTGTVDGTDDTTSAANGDTTGGAADGDTTSAADGDTTGVDDTQDGTDDSLVDGILGGVTPSNPTTPGDTTSPDASGSTEQKIERVIDRGMTQLGITYAWGGGNWYGPTLGIRDGGVADSYGDYNKVGYDCSGLMMYAFYALGIQLDHYSGYQYTSGTQVPVDQARRGDMLFWGIGGSSHVALYLGDGKMLEAPQSGSTVQVSDVRWSGIEPYATRMVE